MNRILNLLLLWSAAFLFGCSPDQTDYQTPAEESNSSTTTTDSPSGSLPQMTYEQQQGEYLFQKYCAICHGSKGEGDGFNAYNLDPRPHSLADSSYVASLSDASLQQVIALGGRGVNKSVLMPPYGNTLDDTHISYLVAYIRHINQPSP